MKIGSILPFAAYSLNSTQKNLSFSGSRFFLSVPVDEKEVDRERIQAELDKEAAQAQKARERGVKVPVYKTRTSEDGLHIKQIRYETTGDIPDPKNNPIKGMHLRNILKNLYYMDKAGIFHNDLDKSHVLIKKDGGVEFDCFRYSTNFYKGFNKLRCDDGSIRTPDFMMPSNEDTFKEHCLGEYVHNLDEGRRYNFVENYLMLRSRYHGMRADMLEDRGFYLKNKALEYEDIQCEVFSNPSNQVVNYEINKLENYRLKRKAFTEWDEGGGACGHEVDAQRRFNAILLNLYCIESSIELRNDAKYLSEHAGTDAERKYFKFEEECAQKRLDDLCNDTKGMGGWNFNDTEHDIYLGTQDEKEFFFNLFDEINPSDIIVSETDIEDVIDYYSELKERWNKKLNGLYKDEFNTRDDS